MDSKAWMDVERRKRELHKQYLEFTNEKVSKCFVQWSFALWVKFSADDILKYIYVGNPQPSGHQLDAHPAEPPRPDP